MYCVSISGNCNGVFDNENDAYNYLIKLEKEGYKEKDGIYLKKYWQLFDTMIWYRQIKKGGFDID